MFRKIGSAVSFMVLSPGLLLLSIGKWLLTCRTISSAFVFRVRPSYLKIWPLRSVETTIILHGVTSETWCKTICLSWNSCIHLSPRRNPVGVRECWSWEVEHLLLQHVSDRMVSICRNYILCC